VDPIMVAAIARYLAEHCSGSIQLSCGKNGPAPHARQCGCRPEPTGQCQGSLGSDCASSCPEPDYSDPDQPYFWDHTNMRLN